MSVQLMMIMIMMRTASLGLCLLLLLLVSSCMNIEHTVGGGPAGTVRIEERASWLAWGLIPIHRVDSDDLAGSATSYRISSGFSFFDLLLNLPTLGFITVKTIRVEK